MKIYKVGGAVRDRLLSFQYHETDWVVIGSSPEEMINLGFTPVGRDFPVFLHPKTKEEYALARTEKKISVGHQGFEFYTDPEITLEEDLDDFDTSRGHYPFFWGNTLIRPKIESRTIFIDK